VWAGFALTLAGLVIFIVTSQRAQQAVAA
jgi:hypothetical protein